MTFELLLLRGKLPLTTPPPSSAVVACLSLANSERGQFYYRSWYSLGPASSASMTKLAGGDQGQTAWMLTRIDFAWAEEKGAAKFTEFQFTKQNGWPEIPLFNFSCFLKKAILSLSSVYALFYGSLCVEWANSTQMSPILMSKTSTVGNCHYFLNLTRFFGEFSRSLWSGIRRDHLQLFSRR